MKPTVHQTYHLTIILKCNCTVLSYKPDICPEETQQKRTPMHAPHRSTSPLQICLGAVR